MQNNRDELYYLIALQAIPGIGAKRAGALLDCAGSARTLFELEPRDLSALEVLPATVLPYFQDPAVFRLADREWQYIEKTGIQVLLKGTKDYPYRLQECADAPLLLYKKGTADLNRDKHIAVVGTRRNTGYGERVCNDLLADMEEVPGITIISGLAYGIDTIAHKAALRHRLPTLGVLAHGLDSIYPAANKDMAREMEAAGALLTEFRSDVKVERGNFPARNRIVAGLADVVVVVESDKRGGALITAYFAQSYHREVVAFPGRVYDTRSSGTHHLIRSNVASLVTGAADLLELMNWLPSPVASSVTKPRQLMLQLSGAEKIVVDAVAARDAIHSDELLTTCGMDSSALASALLMLEMQGLIVALPGKRYRIT